MCLGINFSSDVWITHDIVSIFGCLLATWPFSLRLKNLLVYFCLVDWVLESLSKIILLSFFQ